MEYRAVDRKELRELLGNQCSPMRDKWYVVGPDMFSRRCHVATCSDIHDAIRLAHKLNEGALPA